MQGVLKAKKITEQAYTACPGILRLAKSYSPLRVEAACKRALNGQCFNYTTISNILNNNLDTIGTGQLFLFDMPEHTNLRGPQAYS